MNIEIDDQLVHEAMRSSGSRTKKAAAEAGLRLLVKTHAQGAIRQLRGKVQWEGNLNESRLGRLREQLRSMTIDLATDPSRLSCK